MSEVEAVALEAEEARDLEGAFRDVGIAPLGRNYFGRYREIREAIGAMVEAAEGEAVSVELLREHLDADDLEFIDAIVRNLDAVAERGMKREGHVEPYTSARADADRLEPYLELLRPHLGD